MHTFAPSMLAVLLAQAPAAVGEIAYTTAVDRSLVAAHGVVGSVRPEMIRVDAPQVLAVRVKHDPEDWLQSEPPVVDAFSSPSGDFVIAFCRFPGEGEVDAYVVVRDTVLHTRDVRGRPFDVLETFELPQAAQAMVTLVERRALSVAAGHISDAVDAVLAEDRNEEVVLIFNDLLMLIQPDDDVAAVRRKYEAAVDARNAI